MARLIYQGKTKDVFENTDGTYTLMLKDDATGKDGIFDPGENTVGLSIEGMGKTSLKLSRYYFEKITAAGIPNHYINSDIANATMDVLPAAIFGGGLEFICRRRAAGSFLKRYGSYAAFGTDLNYFVEATLKDDERQDPQITREALVLLGIMTVAEYDLCAELTKKITELIADDLEEKGLELYDIKFEFGKNGGDVMLIDEVSGGCMRVYRGDTFVSPLELGDAVLGQ
ncbi:MAG: phosphoribosylaminoimidazolesuccinocarboxamide synthase [Oscillospiraceae bacterium]|nr:phosphoribosylaminoimidazolesuccinocarboxamide synthase [Oscillospiraceae bacterium]